MLPANRTRGGVTCDTLGRHPPPRPIDENQVAPRLPWEADPMAIELLPRRVAAGVLAVFGVVLMLAAPDTLPGLAVLGLAVAIEVVGVLLERKG